MTENLLTAIEHHVSFAAILAILGYVIKEGKIYGRLKERVNELWFDYCGRKEKLYIPLENGTAPVIPPQPHSGD